MSKVFMRTYMKKVVTLCNYYARRLRYELFTLARTMNILLPYKSNNEARSPIWIMTQFAYVNEQTKKTFRINMPFQRMWAYFFLFGILDSVIFMIIFLLQVSLSSVFETILRRLMIQLQEHATLFLKMLVSAYRNVMFSRLRYIFVCQDTHSSLIKLIKLPARQMKFLFNQKQIFF